MSVLSKTASRFLRNESGATVVEYGLIMALMTVTLLGALSSTGAGVGDKWDGVSDEVGGAMADAGP